MSEQGSSNIFVSENFGYMGLYGGLHAKDIYAKREIKPVQNLLEFRGYSELAANYFCATQAAEKIKRENIQAKSEIEQVHLIVGKAVRQTIIELGGTMPDDLAMPDIRL
jgi:DNA-damage-inducible protein D